MTKKIIVRLRSSHAKDNLLVTIPSQMAQALKGIDHMYCTYNEEKRTVEYKAVE